MQFSPQIISRYNLQKQNMQNSKTVYIMKPYPFSIDAILGKKTDENEEKKQGCNLHHGREDLKEEEFKDNKTVMVEKLSSVSQAYSWLHCTRYNPPKIPRRKRNKANHGTRRPRIPFTPFQQATLEHQFFHEPYMDSDRVEALSINLNISKRRIKIWFQNRRAKQRREATQKEAEHQEMLGSFPEKM